jgi:hypothetical protein
MSSPSSEDALIPEIRNYLIDRFRREPKAHVLASDVVKRTAVSPSQATTGLALLVKDGLLLPGIDTRCETCGRTSSSSIIKDGDPGHCNEHGETPHRRYVFYTATPPMKHMLEVTLPPKGGAADVPSGTRPLAAGFAEPKVDALENADESVKRTLAELATHSASTSASSTAIAASVEKMASGKDPRLAWQIPLVTFILGIGFTIGWDVNKDRFVHREPQKMETREPNVKTTDHPRRLATMPIGAAKVNLQLLARGKCPRSPGRC